MKMNKEAYKKLIEEDLKYLKDNLSSKAQNALELDHIKRVLSESIEMYYPKTTEPC